jgi:Histidine kinase-, DNA gyrase B-, and HSP90-like ATPase
MTVAPDRLLDEIERQRAYLDELPSDFPFPLFNARQALESQRDSGYVSTASAAREIVDNAIEAGARRVHVVFETGQRHTRKVVKNVAFIDDGSGMLPEMARFALTWGGGTHFKQADHAAIGKFGFGLPNASINQTRRVEVYTRTTSRSPFSLTWLDLDKFTRYDQQSVPEPKRAELPAFVESYLKRNNIKLAHGTVVLWVDPDRLTYRTPANLKDHLVDDFGVVYRYLLGAGDEPGVDLVVEGVDVTPIDPLFLLPSAMWHVATAKGGAREMADHRIPVTYWEDKDTFARHLLLADEEPADADNWRILTESWIQVRIARFPVGFVQDRGRKRGPKTEANLRFDVRRERRGISFVRGPREIQTLDRFPPSSRENIAQGLGRWPSIQAYAYHWACEIRFPLELDEPMGISNNKQAVRPSEDVWKVLAQSDVDADLRAENLWQSEQRKRKKPVEKAAGPSPAELAAVDADNAIAQRLTTPRWARGAAEEALRAEAQRRATEAGTSVQSTLTALKNEAQQRRYRVDYYEQEDGPLYRPEWQGSQLVVWVNQLHPFYEEVYSSAIDNVRVKEGFDLLLIALARGEMQTDDQEFHRWYRDQRVQVWSRFLDSAAGWLDTRVSQRAGGGVDESDDDAD